MLSIIVPLYNESESIPSLYQAVVDALDGFPQSFELIFVNDGSTDDSAGKLSELAGRDERVKIISFAGNFGQTAAMMAGFRAAAGDIIVPMDGDLQNDPVDIPMLVEKLNEGFDVVSGWRKDRQDHSIRRNLPSRIANALISKVSGVRLHDHGCTLKAFRADVLRGVRLYGEMHRFISVYASWQGARVCEVPVRHHARKHGQSNYGLGRVIKVLLDLLVVKFLGQYTTKPIYVFGTAGFLCIGLSLLSGLFAVYLKLFQATSFILTPLPLLSTFAFLTGVICILMGLLAELMVRIYFEGQDKTPYVVRNTTNIKNQD